MTLEELKNLISQGYFKNPTQGVINFKEVVQEITSYRRAEKNSRYKIVIGTDSEKRHQGADFVTVVAVQRLGKGGRYFWLESYDQTDFDLRNRIYRETTMSLALAQLLIEEGFDIKTDLEIHVDIGYNGPTREMIKEITGMIRGSGFFVKIKPEAFAAASVADKYL